MERVKIFRPNSYDFLEEKVNEWLAEKGDKIEIKHREIVHVDNVPNAHFTIIIYYIPKD